MLSKEKTVMIFLLIFLISPKVELILFNNVLKTILIIKVL